MASNYGKVGSRLDEELNVIRNDQWSTCWQSIVSEHNDDIGYVWRLVFFSHNSSFWSGKRFRIRIEFENRTIFKVPKVIFETLIFHPNVENNVMKTSYHFDNKWEKSEYAINKLISEVHNLMFTPDLEIASNEHAKRLYNLNLEVFRKMAQLYGETI